MTATATTSEHLTAVAADAFHSHVLPAIRTDFPGVENEITVLVTSSVAYGSADAYSDLDVFIIFRRDRDYRRYASELEHTIDGLDLQTRYGDVCDKGVRFELESLQRSDLAGLFYHPSNQDRWCRQTEWLLSWFLSAVPIHDPCNVWNTMKRRCGTFPPPVRQRREQTARLAIRRWSTRADANGEDRWTFPALRAYWRTLAATLDAAYLCGNVYAPHPKWRYPLARQLLTNPRSHELLNAFDVALGAALRTQAEDMRPALADLHSACAHALPPPNGRSGASLTSTCWPVRRGPDTTWVQHRWDEGALSVLDRAVEHEDIYLWHELGAPYAQRQRWDYDTALRLSDRLRWYERHSQGLRAIPQEGRTVTRRRLRYLNFVIWRKIRVIDKAARRAQPFNAVWYALQVTEHLLELHARLADDFLPPETQPDAFFDLARLVLHPLGPEGTPVDEPAAILSAIHPGSEFVTWAWKELETLQEHLLATGTITPDEANDPLPTQFEVQYWKYENLFI